MNDDSTRDRIILAAGPIFAQKGFKNTTVREICDAANVNVASINYYFSDKQGLYTETVIQAREMRAQQFPHRELDENQPPEEKLKNIVVTLLNRMMAMQTEPWQVRLIMREILQPTEASKKLVKAYFRPFFESLLSVIDELVGVRLPDHERHQLGFSVIGQCMHYRISAEMISMMISKAEYQQSYQIEQLADHITSFSLGGIESIRKQVANNGIKQISTQSNLRLPN
jgi:AcrR family transcriptional regulator